MEPRAVVGQYDSDSGHYTLHVPTQGVFGFTGAMVTQVLGIERERLRVRTYDVGGSFGMKSAPYPEYAPVLIAARLLCLLLKWRDERSDSFLPDQHGRDSWAEASMAFDVGGHILAGRVDEMPYDAVSELTYDSGEFLAVLNAADWSGFEARREASVQKGMLRGLGLASYLEFTGPPAREMGAFALRKMAL